MPDIPERIENATAQLETASQQAHDIANGDDTSTVTTDNGEVKTYAKSIADKEAEYDSAGVLVTTSQNVTDAQTAQAAAEAAQAAVEALDISTVVVANNGTAPNIAANPALNTIDPLTNASAITGGGRLNFENIIGSPVKPKGIDFTPYGWVTDVGYVAGSAAVATISGGYDCVNNQLAGSILGGGHNFLRYSVVGHSTIGGGSYNIIHGGYCVITGGTRNAIGDDVTGSIISGGQQNTIKGVNADFSTINGGDLNLIHGAERSFIGSGNNNVIQSLNGYNSILGGEDNRIGDNETTDQSFRSVIGGGGNNQIISSKRASIGGGEGNSIEAGADYSSILGGNGNTIEAGAIGAVVVGGENNTANSKYGLTHGLHAVNGVHGSHTHTGRRNAVDGDCQAISFAIGNITVDGTTGIYLATDGTLKYAALSDDTNWVGTMFITGREAATGDTYSCKVDFSIRRHGGTNTIQYESKTVMLNDFTLTTEPAIDLHASGLFRVLIKGEAAKTILWSGRVDVASVSG